MVEKLIGVNGYDLEVPLTKHMLVFEYDDRPGVIGAVGASSAKPTSTSAACRSRARTTAPWRAQRRQRHPGRPAAGYPR